MPVSSVPFNSVPLSSTSDSVPVISVPVSRFPVSSVQVSSVPVSGIFVQITGPLGKYSALIQRWSAEYSALICGFSAEQSCNGQLCCQSWLERMAQEERETMGCNKRSGWKRLSCACLAFGDASRTFTFSH